MSSEQRMGHVVELPNAVPADRGLSSLGLLMQLAGGAMTAISALVMMAMLLAIRDTPPFGPERGQTGWVLLILGLSLARSMYHRQAGTALLYTARPRLGIAESPLAGVRLYVRIGLGHAALVALFAHNLDLPAAYVLACAAGLALWPLALCVLLASGALARFETEIPFSEDKGFEGAAILMTVLGVSGVIVAAMLLVANVRTGVSDVPGGFAVFASAALALRSGFHLRAGLAGLRETSLDRAVDLAGRYTTAGVVSSFIAGSALFLPAIELQVEFRDLVVVACACWLLMTWPLIIRRFFTDRQFADLLAGADAEPHRRAPDAGLTALGWLLVGHAVLTASCLVPQLAADTLLGRRFDWLVALGGGLGVHSLWWNAGVIALELWAGYELVRMSPYHRPVAWIYGAVAAAVTVYFAWPVLEVAEELRTVELALLLAAPAVQLVIAIATPLLVTRRIAPSARARYRRAQGKAVGSA